MLPVDEVAANGVSPGKILPFGAIRIPLIAEVPLAVFIKHAVWIVHPSVEWSVVVDRPVFLAVCGVNCIGECDIAPAGILLGLAHRCAVLRGDDIEHNVVAFVGREVKGHGVVGLGFGKSYVNGTVEASVNENVDGGIIIGFLNGQH